MKLTIEKREFAEAVSFVARMSPKRPTQPLLSGVLMRAESGRLDFVVYDYSVSASTDVEAEITAGGTVLVHAASLAKFSSKLPGKSVTLEATSATLELKCGSVKASLPLMDAERYPVPNFESTPIATISGAVFENAVGRIAPAVSLDPAVQHLTGMRMVVTGQAVELSGTDKYRIAHLAIPCETGDPQELIVPGAWIKEAAKAFGGSDVVELTSRDGAIIFAGDRGRIMTQTIDANYPQIERLFPTEPKRLATVEAEALIDASMRASLALEGGGIVEYAFNNGSCTVSGRFDSRGLVESLDAEFSDDPVDIRFNPQYVIDAARACQGQSVAIWFTHTPSDPRPKAVMFTSGDGFRCLVQPNVLGV